jgi:gliding motility-associated-like protein
MCLPFRCSLGSIIFFLILCLSCQSFSQCFPEKGPPLSNSEFTTGGDIAGGPDRSWKIALDSINGPYVPATLMYPLPLIYHNNNHWISFSGTGEHASNRYFFFKKEFDLPCYNLCGKSYNDDDAFCLNLDIYEDNSIYEIYVNGVPQSANLGNIFPLPNPFNPPGHTQSDGTSVSLCKNWKAGKNTIIIVIASSATVVGMMIEVPVNPPPPPDADSIKATICAGEHFHFGSLDLTESGKYFQSFPRPGGCDSNVVLMLNVGPKSSTVIDQTICEGDNFAGYTASGTYVDTYLAANGCDSVRTLNLTVQGNPKPELGTKAAICDGDSFTIAPGLFTTYLWQDGSANDHYTVKSPGLYVVTVTNPCGAARGEIIVKDGICNIFFPNAFTPNHDGKNDFFKILTDYRLQEYHLAVYNRWGQIVYEASNQSKGWDGNWSGKEQQSGIYIWNCVFKRAGITSNMKGTVTLIR